MAGTDRTEGQKPAAATQPRDAEIRRWRLVELLGDNREAIIEHGGETYHLRLTANNKLLLTK